jgi:hypothetical protein
VFRFVICVEVVYTEYGHAQMQIMKMMVGKMFSVIFLDACYRVLSSYATLHTRFNSIHGYGQTVALHYKTTV